MELTNQRTLNLQNGTAVMGVLNVTPDSFSDGGVYCAVDQAVQRAVCMRDEGAAVIDVGPESTRPGALPVDPQEQIRRAIPVITAFREIDGSTPVSIDTCRSEVASAALLAGADIVNDTSALRDDSDMRPLVAASGAPVVLMHRRGTPATMQRGGGPHYESVIRDIAAFLRERVRYAVDGGIDPARVIVDPGIGFGKRVEHNCEIIRRLDRFVALGYPVLVGASRKSFIGRIRSHSAPADRDAGSLACAVLASLRGAAMVRTHNVRPTVDAIRVCQALS